MRTRVQHLRRSRLSPLAVGIWLSITCQAVSQEPFDTVIDAPPTVIGDNETIGSNTQLNVREGGVVGSYFNAGEPDGSSTNVEVNISGGTVGDYFNALAGSQATITGGTVGSYAGAGTGGQLTITAGTVGYRARVGRDGHLIISGGIVDWGLTAYTGGKVTISGGTVGPVAQVLGAEVTLSGGLVGPGFAILRFSEAAISGGDFLLNGVPPVSSTITLTRADVFTGTLEDGTPFIFSRLASDALTDVVLVNAELPPIDTAPIYVDSENAPRGLRQGQSLTLQEGGVLGEYFAAVNATLNVTGGEARNGLEVSGSQVAISAGRIGDGFFAFSDSHVTISGGQVGDGLKVFDDSQATISGGEIGSGFQASHGSEVAITGGIVGSAARVGNGSRMAISGGNMGSSFRALDGGHMAISGGTVGSNLTAFAGSEVTVSGGVLGNNFHAWEDSHVTISGGSVGEGFDARGGSRVDLYGSEFTLDGNEIAELTPGETVTLSARDVELGGRFADGMSFSFELDSSFYVSPDATLTVTLVSLLEGDYNSNGLVEQADLDLVLGNWGAELLSPFAAGWINDLPSGIVDQAELDRVLANWEARTTSSPPGSLNPQLRSFSSCSVWC